MPIPSYILPSAPAYTEDSVYALIPTPSTPIYTPDAISFTRGSDATRTASNGLIQRSPVNLLTYSEDLTNVNWSKAGQGVGLPPVVTGNQGLAPNGTMTADRVQFNCVGTTISDRSYIIQAFTSATIGNRYTMSFYVKAFSISEVGKQLRCITEGGGIPSTIITVTNDWQLVTIPATGNATTTTIVFLVETRGINTVNTTADVLIWGAQLVEGSQPLTYFPTTDRLNVPRIDFSQGGCPALLLEPQRTNLALYSEQFDSATWTKNASATITANSTTAPDGNTNADTLTVTALTFSGIYRVISGASANYTVSIYAKKDTKNWLYIVDIQGSAARAWFNLNSGVLGTVASGYSATITSVGNGWYRCTLTNTTALSALYYQFGLSDSDNSTTPTSSGSAFIYGAQIEVGSYATTYIPTTSTSVTRLADSFSKSNIYTNGLITAAGGTWFIELRNNIAYTRDAGGLNFSFLNAAGNTGFIILPSGGTSARLDIRKIIAGTQTTLTGTTTNTIKIGIKWNGTSADLFVNGVKLTTSTTFTETVLENIIVNGTDVPKFIQAMALFSTPLSDAALITMTT